MYAKVVGKFTLHKNTPSIRTIDEVKLSKIDYLKKGNADALS